VTLKLKQLRLSKSFWQALLALIAFCGMFFVYIYAEKEIDRANEMRIQSHALADELRQSSNDLTRMVRTYIATGNPRYKQHYQEILDIRDGKAPRPEAYDDIYWDLVLDDARPRGFGQAIPLLDLMRQAGFTEAELAKLAEAKSNSDKLTKTELAAMRLIESIGPVTTLQRQAAIHMLYDATYHQAKADIMQPIAEFNHMMEVRTLSIVRYQEQLALILRFSVIALGLLLAYALWRAYRGLHHTLGAPAELLHAHIARIGRGDFVSPIPVDADMQDSVMGWLSQTQINLLQIDTSRKAAELSNHRLTQLYAALSQCNQAIVRSASEAELFPKICRDAVTFGGLKMAWIGHLDEATQLLKPVASYGEGLNYLEMINISVDAALPNGRGPSGTAFRDDAPFWCLDFLNDPATEKWQVLGVQFGWAASAALPLHQAGKVIGTLNLYAEDASYFDIAGKNLLLEMATDIDFALDNFSLEREREQMKQALLVSEERARLVLDNSLDAIVSIDHTGMVTEWNNAAVQIFGYVRDEVLGRDLAEFIVPERDREAHHQGLQRVLTTHHTKMIGKRVEVSALRKDGSEFPAEMTIAQIRRGDTIFFSAFIRDITERKQSEHQIQHLAHYDVLTDLPNRLMLQDHFDYALSLVKRKQGRLAVIFLDLDHFKDINDNLGHSVGDLLLMELTRRLKTLLREEDTLSRLGGDEFILLLPDADANGASNVAQKLLGTVSEPYHIAPYELTVTGSIGIALYPDDGSNLEILSQKADTAMYRAKQAGRNDYRFFTAEMQASSARNLQLLTALRHAQDKDQFALHYQPQFSVDDNHLIGAEALLRWRHPELGFVSPAEFIPVAEDSGMILAIGEWVLRQAVSQAKAWMEAGHEPLIMSVNLSAIQFRHPDLPALVTRILNETGLAPEYLELELTESVAMHDPEGAIAIMNNLHELGIRMSIDDFGTGYSSLSYLKKFKIYKLKIDQSFVRDISTDIEDKAIVSAIINMARSLGHKTIAEGVETKEQLAFLRAQGCDEVQGYYYSKPVPADLFQQFLQKR